MNKNIPIDWLPATKTMTILTPEECNRILDIVLETGMQKAMRLTEDGENVVDTNHRHCETIGFKPGTEVHSLVAGRIRDKLSEINDQYYFDLYPELEALIPIVTINKYEINGRIGMHADTSHFLDTDDRKLSISILLSNEYDGGELMVYDGEVHYPLKGKVIGDAAIFPSFEIHEVEEVTNGVRYCCVVWLKGPRFR